MSRKKTLSATSPPSAVGAGNGGMLGSGVFGMFGTMVQCDAESDSMYCKFMKMFNVLIVIMIIVAGLYFLFRASR